MRDTWFLTFFGGSTAVELSLLSASAEKDRVRLEWSTPLAGLPAIVQRHRPESDWAPLAAVQADEIGRIAHEDRDVTPGTRYGYRLAIHDGGVTRFAGETWVDVPSVAPALSGVFPNPARGPFSVRLSLPDASPAFLELVDVSGRCVSSRDVSGLGAGVHVVVLRDARRAPGVYFVRLRRGEHTLTCRVALVR